MTMYGMAWRSVGRTCCLLPSSTICPIACAFVSSDSVVAQRRMYLPFAFVGVDFSDAIGWHGGS